MMVGKIGLYRLKLFAWKICFYFFRKIIEGLTIVTNDFNKKFIPNFVSFITNRSLSACFFARHYSPVEIQSKSSWVTVYLGSGPEVSVEQDWKSFFFEFVYEFYNLLFKNATKIQKI